MPKTNRKRAADEVEVLEELWMLGAYDTYVVATKFLQRECRRALRPCETDFVRVARLRALTRACEVFVEEMDRHRLVERFLAACYSAGRDHNSDAVVPAGLPHDGKRMRDLSLSELVDLECECSGLPSAQAPPKQTAP